MTTSPDRLRPLDVGVYAPLGALVELRDGLPRWAGVGRGAVERRIVTARSLGQIVVAQVERRLPDVLGDLAERGEEILVGWGVAPRPAPTAAPSSPVTDAVVVPPDVAPEVVAAPGPSVESLPVADYDSLSAVQVLPRLEALAPAQLAAVRAYERANRGRRTILGRVDQLLETP